MLGQITIFLIHTVATFFVFLLLLRFHFQWLRVPFRNQVGEFVLATTSWMVMPARRVIPGLAGLDVPTLLLACLLQGLSLWAQDAVRGADPGVLAVVLASLIDLIRYSLYILVAAVLIEVVFSWINPGTPVAPVIPPVTRPFLRPLRRFVPPIGNFDLTPFVLLILIQVALFVLWDVRPPVGPR
jgi:YggT family protein